MTDAPTLDGPLGIVGAGYIGHLFAQQFALAGYKIRAWSTHRRGTCVRVRAMLELFDGRLGPVD